MKRDFKRERFSPADPTPPERGSHRLGRAVFPLALHSYLICVLEKETVVKLTMALTERNLKLAQSRSGRSTSPGRGSIDAGQSPTSGYLSPGGNASGGWQLETASDTGSARPSEGRRSERAKSLKAAAPETDNVKVICRVRPFNRREYEINAEQNSGIENEWEKIPLRSVVEMTGNDTVFLDHEKEFSERDRFHFDASLWSMPKEQQDSPNGFASQEDVMKIVGDPTLQHIWTGYNTTVFAYGQTGSGKTYSMMGTEEEVGLIPRICHTIFDQMEAKRQEDKEHPEEGQIKEYRLEARFLEIYNERVRDLLWGIRPPDQPTEGLDHLNLKVRNIPNQGPQVMGITCLAVDSSEDCLRLITEGTKNRSVAATKMNAESSRSHSIFRLTLTQTTKILPTKQFEKPKSFDKTSVISLVDLAGSERNKKTGAEGARLKEAVAINQSLTSLKNVIDALVEGRTVIPFRDSQLTWLLSESLGGNSKTFMIACVSPHADNAEETLNTLRYAARAQKIVTHAQVNESEEMRRMNKLREELDRLQRQRDENPNETMLEEEYAEQKRRLEELQNESLRKQQEEETLAKIANRHQDMRYTQNFHHAFRVALYKRIERKYKDNNAVLKQRVEVRTSETNRLRENIEEVDAETKECRDDEKKAKDIMTDLEHKLKLLQQSCASLEEQKGELVAKEDRLKEAQEKKAELVNVAKHLGKVLCAHRRYVFDRKVERLQAEKSVELRNIADSQVQWNVDTEEAHNDKMQNLKTEGNRLRAHLDAMQNKLAKVSKAKSEKITSLHAACIFYENETKRCAPDLEKGLATVNKACSAKFYADKEALAQKANDLMIQLEQQTAKASAEFQSRNSAAELEVMTEVENAELAGREAHDNVIRSYEKRQEGLNSTWERRLKLLEALNVDTEHFLKETRHAEPRYAKLYDPISFLLDPSASSDPQIKDIAEKLRNVKMTLESVTPQPFKFVSHHVEVQELVETPPKYGQPSTPRSSHRTPSPAATSHASPSAHREESAPGTPRTGRAGPPTAMQTPRSIASLVATPRSTSPASSQRLKALERTGERTMDLHGPFATKREDISRPSSLETPKRLIPTTTKTSRLRTELLPKKSAGASPSSGQDQTRSMTPRTARETLAILLSEEPHKVAVGGTYFLSRSRSPTMRPYRSTSPGAPKAALPHGNRTTTPSRSTTPRGTSNGLSTPRR